MSEGLSARLAGFAAGLSAADIPAETSAAIRLSALDWAAVALAGRDEPVARIMRNVVSAEGGRAEAFVFGAARAPVRSAALVNGATGHALDYDDTHFLHIGHPSVVIFPAALAMAERVGASGAAFLTAATIGFEASIRTGHWLGRRHYEHGFHQTATAGCFGATLAAGRLLGLAPEPMGHALGIAATRASGLKSQFGTMGKPYNAGLAAANGVEAALLAGAGFISRPDGLECEQGFGETHAGAATHAALDGLGARFLLGDVSYKFHACCHGLHAALEALAALTGGGVYSAPEIEVLRVCTHPRWLGVCNIAKPRTGLEAKFSYRMVAALALAGHDTGALGTYADDTCADPLLVALRDKVEVIADDGLAESAARVELCLTTGATERCEYDLNQPMSATDKQGRLRRKAVALTGAARTESLQRAIDDLPEAESIAGFVAALG